MYQAAYMRPCEARDAEDRTSARSRCAAVVCRMAISLAAVLLPALSAFAQNVANTGEIKGVVRDPDQAMVPNCPVTLTNRETTIKTTGVADAQGAYSFHVPPGTYRVQADGPGFQTSVSPELKVEAGQSLNFDFALTIPGV